MTFCLHVHFKKGPVHTNLTVFVGAHQQALANAGIMTLRNHEFDDFRKLLEAQAEKMHSLGYRILFLNKAKT